MEVDVSPELKRQIRKSLPRRSLSYDRETAYNSTSISAALCSSPNSSHVNLVSSTARDPRTSSPERKATFRLSTDLSTVQESPVAQSNEELDKEHQQHSGEEAAATQDTAQGDKDHILPADNVTGLNITGNGASHPRPIEEQSLGPPGTQSVQQVGEIHATVAGVANPDGGLDLGSNKHETADESSLSEPSSTAGTEEQTNKDDGKPSQPVMNATTLPKTDDLAQPSHPTEGSEGKLQDASSSAPRVVGRVVEHLEVPPDGEGRPSSESASLFQDASDVGKEEVHEHRARNLSQTDSHAREKMEKDNGTSESVTENERRGRRWFKFVLKKIPCFN